MASHMTVNESKGKGKGKRLAWIIPLVVLGVALLAYLGGVVFFNFYFMPGTTLDGQDVSLRSAREVAEEKSEALASYQTHVSGAGVDLTLAAADIDLSYDGDTYAREAVDQTEPWAWPVQLASGTRDVSVESGVLFDQQALLALINPFVDQATQAAGELGGKVVTYDAELGSFTLDPSATARYLDSDAVIETLSQGFAAQEPEIVLGSDVITVEKDDVHAAIDAANAYLGAAGSTLTLDGETAAEVTKDDIAGWVSVSDDLSVSLNSDAVSSWVSSHVKNLNTKGSDRTFERPDGKKVKVSGGNYGWKVSAGDAADALVQAVSGGTPQAVEIPFEERGEVVPDSGGRDWGKRYIDIDLSEQHVRLYDENGKVIWESDCVTGNASDGHDTPTGVYAVNKYKARNQTLIGFDEDKDGEPDYESHVDYWIPFVDNVIALHDANWRGSFGGNIYKWGGSHGCVNLPVQKAAEIYELSKVGDVVVVHY